MQEMLKQKQRSYLLFNQIAPTYDLLNRLLSFGIDHYWRRKLKNSLPNKNNLQVLDLATGTGDLALTLAKSTKIKSITATDLSEGMLNFAQSKFKQSPQSSKLSIEKADGTNLQYDEQTFDVITISFGIRNFSCHHKGLCEMYRCLKKDGNVYILEFSLPQSLLLRSFYLFYFRKILPWVGSFISGHKNAYHYLNQTVEEFPYGKAFLADMKKAGFSNLQATTLTFGIATLYQGKKE